MKWGVSCGLERWMLIVLKDFLWSAAIRVGYNGFLWQQENSVEASAESFQASSRNDYCQIYCFLQENEASVDTIVLFSPQWKAAKIENHSMKPKQMFFSCLLIVCIYILCIKSCWSLTPLKFFLTKYNYQHEQILSGCFPTFPFSIRQVGNLL